MNFSSPVLSIEIDGHVATLWLDRPEKRNAMSHEMWSNLRPAIDAIAAEPEVRAVVLAGRGKSFCVGIDLGDLGNQPAAIRILTDIGLADQGFTTQFSATCRNGLCGVCTTSIINHDARASAGH